MYLTTFSPHEMYLTPFLHPEAYPWSSWHANVGTRRSVLVTPHPEYLALGSGAGERYTCYRALVLQHETEEMTAQLRDATQQNAGFRLTTLRPRNRADARAWREHQT